jgi:CRP-like cAMP-binding protein
MPSFDNYIVHRLEIQICALHDHAVLLGRKTATERVSTYILNLAQSAHENENSPPPQALVIVPMTRSEIADYLGLTLETVSRAFSRLKRLGVISYERHDGPMRVALDRLGPLTGTYWT